MTRRCDARRGYADAALMAARGARRHARDAAGASPVPFGWTSSEYARGAALFAASAAAYARRCGACAAAARAMAARRAGLARPDAPQR